MNRQAATRSLLKQADVDGLSRLDITAREFMRRAAHRSRIFTKPRMPAAQIRGFVTPFVDGPALPDDQTSGGHPKPAQPGWESGLKPT